MRFLIYGDLQSDEGSARLFSDPTIPLQRWRTQHFFEQIEPLAAQCDGVIDLGDTTDNRSSIAIPTLDTLLAGVGRLPKGLNFKLIGNHEQYIKGNSCHSGRLLARKFKIVSRTRVHEIDDGVLVFASFYSDTKELVESLKTIFKAHRKQRIFFFGHFAVLGASMRSGVCTEGIPIETLDPAAVGLLGHIHRWQKLRKGLYYVGSPFEQDFGESGDRKCVAILDTATAKLKWIELTGFPKYKVSSVTQFQEDFDPASEDRHRVRIRNNKDADVFYAHPYSARAEPEYVFENEPVAPADTKPRGKQDFHTLLAQYLKTKPPEGDIDAADVLKTAELILHEA